MRRNDREQAAYTHDPPVAAPSPMMAQYLAIKADHADALLFYRMGDFYELFFADAEAAARTLGIVLTRRGRHEGADIPMCGVPVERRSSVGNPRNFALPADRCDFIRDSASSDS